MGKAPKPWSPSNFVFGYSYQNNSRRNQQIEEYFLKTTQATIGYSFSKGTKYIKPFRKMKSKKLNLIKDFNFNFIPSSFSTQIQANRLYSETQSEATKITSIFKKHKISSQQIGQIVSKKGVSVKLEKL